MLNVFQCQGQSALYLIQTLYFKPTKTELSPYQELEAFTISHALYLRQYVKSAGITAKDPA